MTRDEVSLLAAITAAPDDDEPRIAYADWLKEVGDPRGEWIAIQCALARRRTPELEARERHLRERHAAEWLAHAGLAPGEGRFQRGFIEHVEASAARRGWPARSMRSLRCHVCARCAQGSTWAATRPSCSSSQSGCATACQPRWST